MDFVSAHGGAIPADGMGAAGPVHAPAGGARQARDRLGLPRPWQGAVALRRHRVQRHRARCGAAARKAARRIRLHADVEHPSGPDPADPRGLRARRAGRSKSLRKSSLPQPRAAVGADQLSTAHCTTAPATAISGRCSSGRTPPAGSCLPRRRRWFASRASLKSTRERSHHEDDCPDRSPPRCSPCRFARAGPDQRCQTAPTASRPPTRPARRSCRRWCPSAVIKARRRSHADRRRDRRHPDGADLEGGRDRSMTGNIQCELGASVNIDADTRSAGFFIVTHAGVKYRMHPVESRTGAIRLEDPVRGAMWLQLGNKSMLMSQKQGQRLADECQARPAGRGGRRHEEEPAQEPVRRRRRGIGRQDRSNPPPAARLLLPSGSRPPICVSGEKKMLQAYVDHVAERAALGIPPLPLSAKQTAELIELLKTPAIAEAEFLLNLITHRVPAGVDDAAKVKASYLAAVAHGTEKCLLHQPRQGDRAARHHARRLQHRTADRPARRRRSRRRRGRGPEEDAADVRPVPRRQGKGRQGQCQCQGRAAKLGRRRVVHQPARSAAKHHRQHLQGGRRNQHRRPVARARR